MMNLVKDDQAKCSLNLPYFKIIEMYIYAT